MREQVETWLGASRIGYDIANEGLIVWPGQDYGEQVLYGLQPWDGGEYEEDGRGPSGGIAGDASRLQLSRRPLPWRRWVEIWERDQAGGGHPEAAIAGLTVLPGNDFEVGIQVTDTLQSRGDDEVCQEY